MLKGLNGDTPLAYYIRIRSETDSKKIQEMSQDEKKIRNDWLRFKQSQENKLTDSEKKEKVKEFHQIIKSMFGGDSR